MNRLKTLTITVIITLLAVFILNVEQTSAQSVDEQAVLTLINAERAALSLPPYAWDTCLAAAATVHSNDMSANGFVGHTGSDNSSPWDRIADAGYPSNSARAENVAGGQTTPAIVVAAWMNSPGHQANILSTSYSYVGISRVGNYWTNTFGSVPCNAGSSSSTGTTSGSTTGGSTGTTSTGSTTGGSTGTTSGSTTGGSTGTTSTGSTTGGSTTGTTGTTSGSTTGGSTGTTSTGSTTGGSTGTTSTGSTTGGSTGTTSTGSTTGSSSTGSSTGSGSSSSSNNVVVQTTVTSSNPPDNCASGGGTVQVSSVNGMTCTSLSSAGVGNQFVIDQGFVNAVDVWGSFTGSVEVCLQGAGSLIFMDAAGAPRVPQPIASFVRNGMICTTISTPGSVILVGAPNLAPQNVVTTNTQVTTTTTTTAAPTVNTNGNIIHVVQAGENLFRIGLRYGVPYQQIAAVNGIASDFRIYAGQQLIIP